MLASILTRGRGGGGMSTLRGGGGLRGSSVMSTKSFLWPERDKKGAKIT